MDKNHILYSTYKKQVIVRVKSYSTILLFNSDLYEGVN